MSVRVWEGSLGVWGGRRITVEWGTSLHFRPFLHREMCRRFLSRARHWLPLPRLCGFRLPIEWRIVCKNRLDHDQTFSLSWSFTGPQDNQRKTLTRTLPLSLRVGCVAIERWSDSLSEPCWQEHVDSGWRYANEHGHCGTWNRMYVWLLNQAQSKKKRKRKWKSTSKKTEWRICCLPQQQISYRHDFRRIVRQFHVD